MEYIPAADFLLHKTKRRRSIRLIDQADVSVEAQHTAAKIFSFLRLAPRRPASEPPEHSPLGLQPATGVGAPSRRFEFIGTERAVKISALTWQV